jgi:hypothetical protein
MLTDNCYDHSRFVCQHQLMQLQRLWKFFVNRDKCTVHGSFDEGFLTLLSSLFQGLSVRRLRELKTDPMTERDDLDITRTEIKDGIKNETFPCGLSWKKNNDLKWSHPTDSVHLKIRIPAQLCWNWYKINWIQWNVTCKNKTDTSGLRW